MPLTHYRDVMSSAYDFIRENPQEVENLRNEYVTFSENLLNYIKSKGQDINTNQFFFSNVLDIQKDITYGQDYEMTDESQ